MNAFICLCILSVFIYQHCLKVLDELIIIQIRKCQLNAEDTRNLLICFTWVLKNVDKSVLRQWWTDMPINRLDCILEIIYYAISNFEYRVCTKWFMSVLYVNDKTHNCNTWFLKKVFLIWTSCFSLYSVKMSIFFKCVNIELEELNMTQKSAYEVWLLTIHRMLHHVLLYYTMLHHVLCIHHVKLRDILLFPSIMMKLIVIYLLIENLNCFLFELSAWLIS